MANRLGNKIWKEKSRIGMSRKKTKSKNYFTKQEKGTVVEWIEPFNVYHIPIVVYLTLIRCILDFRLFCFSKEKND